ncbi:Alpha/gamma-adaptin-binding protein p34 [Penicillium brevicompactum]|uniref:Alpha/gamma-adaptin-binding protein p34 n=1 Tax=Penicillium brevicompactum TaxID=5074 RepID=UPI002541EE42|nr:Alpha/gamma-adaptin-binding protein p34 [Penicillium brevicompactum]KAJ5319303.1 Alpha/gamma-adaptin-binding protein p34 [Penicillium brevicompactum]
MASSSNNPAAPTTKPKAKTISNPRRLLILSPPTQSLTIIPPLLDSLTGVPITNPPQLEDPAAAPSFAGYTTHSPLRLETKYYNTEVPVWVDEIPLSDTKEQWKTDFLSEEAQIVREAVGALLVCAHAPETGPPNTDSNDLSGREDVRALRDVMRGIGAVKEKIDEDRGGVGDVSGVFVLVGPRKVSSSSGSKTTSNESDLGGDLGDDLGDVVPLSVSWWEDQFYDMGLLGWEVIEWDPKEGGEETRNQYGEREGMPRIKEVLETHDWTMTSAEIEDDSDAEDDLEDKLLGVSNSRGFGSEVHELEREMFGLRMAIERGGGDGADEDEDGPNADDGELDVESMESLMMRMQTIRDMGSDLPEAERKRFAAKAIQDIMREL